MNKIVTTEGIEVIVKPVSAQLFEQIGLNIEKKYRERGEPITPPTYEVSTIAGTVETHVHDESSLQTEEDKEKWAAYQDALARMSKEKSDLSTRFLLLNGVQFELPDNDTWIKRQESFGFVVPDDPTDRLLHYMMTELFKTVADVTNVTIKIVSLTYDGIDPELLRAAEESFRGSLSGKRVKDTVEEPATE